MSAQQAKRKPYEVIQATGYKTLRLVGNLELEDTKSFESEINGIVSDPAEHVVVNCQHIPCMSSPWVRALVNLNGRLQDAKMQLRMICVEPRLELFLKSEGVNDLLKCASSLREALILFGITKKKAIDIEFINPFLHATTLVLKRQAETDAVAGKPFTKLDQKYNGDVSGVIGLVSDSFSGSVVISFPEKTFLAIMSKMLGEKYEKLVPELTDGAAELLNIIFGQAKVSLNAKGYAIKTALPSVVIGSNHTVHTKTSGPTVVVPFDSEAGIFYVEICASL